MNYLSKECIDGDDWLIAIDPENIGKEEKWYKNPIFFGEPAVVPGCIQNNFVGYHGVAWYSKEVYIYENINENGRYLLDFRAIDYLCDVWVNGEHVGMHECGETPFTFDITDVVKINSKNLIVIRVLNPSQTQRIDDIILKEVPSGGKSDFLASNSLFNSGGIISSVNIIYAPSVYIKDVYIITDFKTGKVTANITVENTQNKNVSAKFDFQIKPYKRYDDVFIKEELSKNLKIGENLIVIETIVSDFKLWSHIDPYLYETITEVTVNNSCDVKKVKTGFRYFTFENGAFYLNGKRVYLKGYGGRAHYPGTYSVPENRSVLEKDIITMKMCGFNACRASFGGLREEVLDMFDEYGIIAVMGHYADWQLDFTDRAEYLFLKSISEIMLRDRNHPSVVAWGLCNELNKIDKVFRYATKCLPEIRKIDNTRLCILNSGRQDGDWSIGSLSSPFSDTWDISMNEFIDLHMYINRDAESIDIIRGKLQEHHDLKSREGVASWANSTFYITEWGSCSQVNYPSALRNFKNYELLNTDEANLYKKNYNLFKRDFDRFGLSDFWIDHDKYFFDAQKYWVNYRKIQETAFRSNPQIIGSIINLMPADQALSQGDGITSVFREEKPGIFEGIRCLNYDVRWCLFTEPYCVFTDEKFNLDVVLSNLDTLETGDYPVLVKIIDDSGMPVFAHRTSFTIKYNEKGEAEKFVIPVFKEDLALKNAGKYKIIASIENGFDVPCGETQVYIFDKKPTFDVPNDVVYIGNDENILNWLKERHVNIVSLDNMDISKKYLILQCGDVENKKSVIDDLLKYINTGSHVIFLDKEVFSNGEDSVAYLPLEEKGVFSEWFNWVALYYRADFIAKEHPVFNGLPTGLFEPYIYRNVGECEVLTNITNGQINGYLEKLEEIPLTMPDETIAVGVRTSANYKSGICVGLYDYGKGSFLINTLRIKENISTDPVASIILRNMLNYGRELIK